MDRASWYRLDNVGKFYSAEAGGSTQTVFRFSAVLDDDIDPEVLQAALDRAVARYPSFNVCLRSGFFWHYLEPAPTMPLVQPEVLPICFGLHTGPKSVLFRVSWFQDRVNLEVSHMVSDGRGTLGFFKELVGSYVTLRHGGPKEPDVEANQLEAEREDGFSKHYERSKAASTPTQRAWRIKGLRDTANPTYLEYHLPAAEVHAAAKDRGVSVTSLVIAAVICALRSTRPAQDADRPIRLTVPVDLRRFFESDTMRNFFGLATVEDENAAKTLEEIAATVQRQISNAARPEQLEKRMNQMIALERNPLLRAAPLFLKDLVLEAAARISARDITSAVSSLGRLSFGERTDAHVRSVNLLTSTQDLNFLVCTFGNDLSIGISTIFTDLAPIRHFCRIFSGLGIDGYINVNKDARGIDRDLRSARLEETVRQLGDLRRKEVGHGTLR